MNELQRPEFADLLARRRTVAPGDVVFLEGHEPDALYVVLKGEVQIVLTDSQGKQVIINRLKAGEIMGEVELLGPHKKCTATALSHDGCELLALDRAKVEARVAAADPFVRFMMGHLCDIIKGWTDAAKKS